MTFHGTGRLSILAGIIDSDGHMTNNCYDLVFKSNLLANDIVELSKSLGFRTVIYECNKTCKNSQTEQPNKQNAKADKSLPIISTGVHVHSKALLCILFGSLLVFWFVHFVHGCLCCLRSMNQA